MLLLYSRFGVDNLNILGGSSNRFEMIHFFEESLQAADHVMWGIQNENRLVRQIEI